MKKLYDMILLKFKKVIQNISFTIDTFYITAYLVFITVVLYYLFFVMLK